MLPLFYFYKNLWYNIYKIKERIDNMRNINEALHEHLAEVLKIYPEDQVLGI